MAKRDPQRSNYAIVLSILGHAAIVAALTFSIPLAAPHRAGIPNVVPVDTVMLDEAAVDAEIARLEAEEQAEAERQKEAERQAEAERERVAREVEEQRQEHLRVEQERAEAERRAEEEKIRLARLEEQRKAEEERKQSEAREAARKAAEEKARQEELARQQREAEERRQREEAERQRREAARRAQVAAEVAQAAAAEEAARRAEEAGLKEQWILAITNKIQRNWNRPPSARPGLDCLLTVNQIPGGDITNVKVDECNGDEVVVRSVETAVLGSSPLPPPPVPELFERVIHVRFKPDE